MSGGAVAAAAAAAGNNDASIQYDMAFMVFHSSRAHSFTHSLT